MSRNASFACPETARSADAHGRSLVSSELDSRVRPRRAFSKEDVVRRLAQFALAAARVAVAVQAATVAGAARATPNQNSILFPLNAHPYGADMATWGERATQWIDAQPLDRNPVFDPTGANCAVAQHGPVWFIARIAGPPVFSGERWCTIPHGKALFLYIGAAADTYPRPPEFNFEPVPA